MNDWVGFVDQRDVNGLKCCVIAFRSKKLTALPSIPDTLMFKNAFMGDITFSSKEEIFPKSSDMADSCQQETPFPPTAFLWFGFNMIPRRCQRRNLCCDG